MLNRIIAQKRNEIKQCKQDLPLSVLKERIAGRAAPLDFAQAHIGHMMTYRTGRYTYTAAVLEGRRYHLAGGLSAGDDIRGKLLDDFGFDLRGNPVVLLLSPSLVQQGKGAITSESLCKGSNICRSQIHGLGNLARREPAVVEHRQQKDFHL